MSGFSTLPTVDGGYDVIDTATGRPVGHEDDWQAAHATANLLSGIESVSGSAALVKALNRKERHGSIIYDARDPDPEDDIGREALFGGVSL